MQAAVTVARRVAWEKKVDLGQEVCCYNSVTVAFGGRLLSGTAMMQ